MQRNKTIQYLAFVCCVLLLISWLPTTAQAENDAQTQVDPTVDLQDEIDKLREQEEALRKQLEKLEGKLVNNTEAIVDAVNQKDTLDQQIILLHEQINNADAQVAGYTRMIADKQAELDAALAEQEELRVKHKQRIRAMEERGKMSYWNILFRATSITDLLDRLSMIRQIAEADQRNLNDLRRVSTIALVAKDDLERKRSELDDSRALLNQAYEELDAKRQEADQILQGLVAKGLEYELLMEKSEDKQDELLTQLAQKKSDYNRQAYEEWLQNNQEGDAPLYYDDQWLSPLDKYRITSPFGMRFHPILNRYRMHNGIDMAAAANTPIYAARGGLVVTASYQKDGAGNYVQLDHGDGFRSIYMHMTRYVVKTGDYVAPGQVIGYVGSTGLSTGNHLHFGISLNGTYINPLEYIPN